MQCSHCKIDYHTTLEEVVVNGKKLHFCCSGCKNVYFFINENELSSFYDRLNNATLSPPKIENIDYSNFDSKSFSKKYIKRLENGQNSLSIIIADTHCVACFWLIERVLLSIGVLEIAFNQTNSKATLIFDDEVKISEIFRQIANLGYHALPYDSDTQDAIIEKKNQKLFMQLVVSVFVSMNIMWLAITQWLANDIDFAMNLALNLAKFALSSVCLFYSGTSFWRGALNAIKTKIINTDLLLIFGVTVIYGYSIFEIFANGETYFESISMVITFILAGKFIENKMMAKALLSLSKNSFSVSSDCKVYRDGKIIEVLKEEVQIGEILRIDIGEMVPLDGLLLDDGVFDLSNINGESLPNKKYKGQNISAGAINLDTQIKIKATKTFENSYISEVVKLMEGALAKKSGLLLLNNKIAGYFGAVVLVLASLSFIFNFYHSNFIDAFIASVCVIIIACPCAFSLSVPIATIIALNLAYKRGIIFKNSSIFEIIKNAKSYAFDKTGTLTTGLKVYEIRDKNLSVFKIRILKTLTSNPHPISIAVNKFLCEKYENITPAIFEIKQALGGVSGEIDGLKIYGGNLKFMMENNFAFSDLEKQDLENKYSSFIVGIRGRDHTNGEIIATFLIDSHIKAGAKEMMQTLKNNNLKIIMLSGDNLKSVEECAKTLRIEGLGDLSTKAKADQIKMLEKPAIMVGDGINDVLALNNASASISFDTSSQLSKNSADVILLNDKIDQIITMIEIAKTTQKIIKQNIALAFLYNFLAVPIAFMGLLNPAIAAICMSGSSILVVLNSLRIYKILK